MAEGIRGRSAPRVSVIVSFLDEERYLSEAIDSVCAQLWTDWELILVDDGSTDGSTEIAKSAAARDAQRVRYLEHSEHRNAGMSASRNLGLAHARAELVAFLDADDRWLPDKLGTLVGILDDAPSAAMGFGALQIVDSIGREVGQFPVRVPSNQLLPPPLFLRQLLLGPRPPTTSSNPVFRRSALAQVGGFEDCFRGQGEDLVTWAKIAIALPTVAVDRALVQYRRHAAASGVTDERAGTLADGELRVARWLLGYLAARSAETRRWAEPIAHEYLFRAAIAAAWAAHADEHGARLFAVRRARLWLAWRALRTEMSGLSTPARWLSVLAQLVAGLRGRRAADLVLRMA